MKYADEPGYSNGIDCYMKHGGYGELKKAVTMKPEDICAEVMESGVRGRGGAVLARVILPGSHRPATAAVVVRVVHRIGPCPRERLQISGRVVLEGLRRPVRQVELFHPAAIIVDVGGCLRIPRPGCRFRSGCRVDLVCVRVRVGRRTRAGVGDRFEPAMRVVTVRDGSYLGVIGIEPLLRLLPSM